MTLTLLEPVRIIGTKYCYPARPVGARFGVMPHFDDSTSDASGEGWFRDPRCHVSYNRLYLDNGDVVQITSLMEEAAYHAGHCRTPNANRAFYGLAAATNEKTPVTKPQFESMAHDTAALFLLNRWPAADVTRRIRGHEEEAIYTKAEFPKKPELWGKLGRKIDPTGLHPDRPILSLMQLRHRVLEHLGAL